jgi:hypothetical protein
MHKQLRNWLFFIFIILFIVITFFVALYAAGYSINKSWPPRFNNLFQKTGMLIVASEPSGATIFINEERQKKFLLLDIGRDDITTPTKVKNLAPGEYNLRLEKEGYWPLEKKIKITSGQNTFEENFIMFRKSLPLNMTTCQPQDILFSPNKRNLILQDDSLLINLKTGLINELPDISDNFVQWSKNSNQILINRTIVNLNGAKVSKRLEMLHPDAHNIYWDENGKRLYFQIEKNIKYLAIDDNIVYPLLSTGEYLSYAVYQNLIYTIEKQNKKIYLKIYDLNSSLLKFSNEMPSGDYNFYQDNYRLNLYNDTNKSLYILNASEANPILQKISTVNSWQWLNNNFIIWKNDFEIYSMDITNGQRNLIIRLSEPLTGMAWNKSKTYIIYASANNIWIANMNLEKLTPINLLTANEISNIQLDEKNQLIYFYARIGKQAGIYKLQLQ